MICSENRKYVPSCLAPFVVLASRVLKGRVLQTPQTMQGFVVSGLQARRRRQRMYIKWPAKSEGRPEYRGTRTKERLKGGLPGEGGKADVELPRDERRKTSY